MKRSDIKVGTIYAVGDNTKGLWPGSYRLRKVVVVDLGQGSAVMAQRVSDSGDPYYSAFKVPLGWVVCPWADHAEAKALADAESKKHAAQYKADEERLIARRNEAVTYLVATLPADVLRGVDTTPVTERQQGVERMDVINLAKIVQAAFAAGQASVKEN